MDIQAEIVCDQFVGAASGLYSNTILLRKIASTGGLNRSKPPALGRGYAPSSDLYGFLDLGRAVRTGYQASFRAS